MVLRKRRFLTLSQTAHSRSDTDTDRPSSDSTSTSAQIHGPPAPSTSVTTESAETSRICTLDDYRVDSPTSTSESEYIPMPIKRMKRHEAGKVHSILLTCLVVIVVIVLVPVGW